MEHKTILSDFISNKFKNILSNKKNIDRIIFENNLNNDNELSKNDMVKYIKIFFEDLEKKMKENSELKPDKKKIKELLQKHILKFKNYKKNIQFIKDIKKNTQKKHRSLPDLYTKKKKTFKKIYRYSDKKSNSSIRNKNAYLKLLSDILKLSDHKIKQNIIKNGYFKNLYLKNTNYITSEKKKVSKTNLTKFLVILKRVTNEELKRIRKDKNIYGTVSIDQKIQNIIDSHFERDQKMKLKKIYENNQKKYFKDIRKILFKKHSNLKKLEINFDGDEAITNIGSIGILPKEIQDLLTNENGYQYFRYGSIGDGNCLFHSFLEGVNQDYFNLDSNNVIEKHQKKRKASALRKYMAKNVNEHYMKYFNINHLFNKNEYIKHLLNDGEYGENDDITFFSALKNVNIFVFQSGLDENKISISPVAINNLTFNIKLPTMFIYNMNQVHYEPIIRLTNLDLSKNNLNKENLKNHILIPPGEPIVKKIALKYLELHFDNIISFRNWEIDTPNYYELINNKIKILEKEYEIEKNKKIKNKILLAQKKSVLIESKKRKESMKKYIDCYTQKNKNYIPDRKGLCKLNDYLFIIPNTSDTCCSNKKEYKDAYKPNHEIIKEKLSLTHKNIRNIDLKDYFENKKNKKFTFNSIYLEAKKFCINSELSIKDSEIKNIIKQNINHPKKKDDREKFIEFIIEQIINYIMKKNSVLILNSKKKCLSFYKNLPEFDRKNIADEDSGGGFSKQEMNLDFGYGKKKTTVLIGNSIEKLINDEHNKIATIKDLDVRSLYYNIIDEDGDDDWIRIGLIFYHLNKMKSYEIIEKDIN